MAIITGARHRLALTAGNTGDLSGYGPFLWPGVPVDGTSGSFAGFALKGGILIDNTNGKLYVNGNTTASPTWKLVTSAA